MRIVIAPGGTPGQRRLARVTPGEPASHRFTGGTADPSVVTWAGAR
jgi:hypothetical protein